MDTDRAIADLRMELARSNQERDLARADAARLLQMLEDQGAEFRDYRVNAEATQKDLIGRVAELSEQVATSNERIAELLAIAQRKKRKPRRKPPEPKAPPNVDEATRRAFDQRPVPPQVPPKPDKPKKRSKPTGRKRLPEHLVADEHLLVPEQCHCGCTQLDLVDEVVEEKLTVVKEHVRRRVVRRKTGRCRLCNSRITPRSLPAPFARSKATCAFLAWLAVQKYVLLLPLDRIRELLRVQGVPLSMSYLVSQTQRIASLLGPIDGAQWKQLLAGGWMTHDATHLNVLVPDVPGTHNGHLEVFQRDGIVVFQYEHDKAAKPLATKLTTFTGTLVADAEHRHNATFATGRVIEAGCNAHGERKLEAAENSRPALASEGRTFIKAIFVEEAKARERGLEGAELLAWRRSRIAPLYEEFRVWMQAVLPTLIPDEPLAKVLRYYTNHWDALVRWVSDPRLPPTNSESEREFQRVAKLRHACLFAGGTEGAHTMATIMGLAATCRHLDIDPQAYFTWALERRGTHADLFGLAAEQLTPTAYKAATNP